MDIYFHARDNRKTGADAEVEGALEKARVRLLALGYEFDWGWASPSRFTLRQIRRAAPDNLDTVRVYSTKPGNISTYRKTRVLTQGQWAEVAATLNFMLDSYGISARIMTMGGSVILRDRGGARTYTNLDASSRYVHDGGANNETYPP